MESDQTLIQRIQKRHLLLGGGALFVLYLIFSWNFFVPDYRSLRQKYRSSDRVLLDRNGEVIDEVRVDKRVRRLEWVEIDKISKNLLEAIRIAEDERFYSHPGVDPLAIAAAAYQGAVTGRWRGASTITMQLVSLLDSESSGINRRGRRKSAWDKVREVYGALWLDAKWTKAQILESYLNLVYFRGEIQGISAASFGLLRKATFALTKTDAAVLSVLVRAPNAKTDKIGTRACRLLEELHERHSCPRVQAQVESVFSRPYEIRPLVRLAPHVARQLLNQTASGAYQRVRSTLDRDLQLFVTESLRRQVLKNRKQNMTDGAVLVLDNATGDVLAYVANTGADSRAPYVDGVRAQRQAGSTLKPFLFGKAIDRRILTAASLLRDEPLEISVATGLYRPQNYDRRYRENVSVRSSLGSSLNIPAVRALDLLGVEEFVHALQAFGIRGLRRDDFYGPSLALGAADVTLWDLTNAYRALANGGVHRAQRLKPDVPAGDGTRALSEGAAFIIADILADREARSLTFGLENMLSTRFWTAVKTGTSKDMRDNWTVGFSRRYTVGVWTGNFAGDSMWNVTGIHGAAPVWLDVMNYLHEREPSPPPQRPSGVITQQVRFEHTGQILWEHFLEGTDVTRDVRPQAQEVRTRIVYPQDQTLIAIDPDIAESRQRVFFQVRGSTEGLSLELNSQKIGPAGAFVPWKPIAGQYRLRLVDASGRVVDQIRFEVRGQTYASR